MTRRTLGLTLSLLVTLALATAGTAQANDDTHESAAVVTVSVMNTPPYNTPKASLMKPTLESKIRSQLDALAAGTDANEIPLRADLARATSERELGLAPLAGPEPAALILPLTHGTF